MLKIPSLIPFLKHSSIALSGVVVFVLALSSLYFVDTTFRAKNIVVTNSTKNNPVAGLPEIENKHMFLTSEDDIADIITRTNPTVRSVSVVKEYPDTIRLTVNRYTPAVYLKSTDGYFLLGDEGRIIAKSKEREKADLPVITYYQSLSFAQYQAGSQLPSKDIRDTIFFLKKLGELGVKINSIDIAGFHMLGLYTDERKFYFSSEKEREIQIYHVEQAIRRFEYEDSGFKSIDVRFEKPVITF